MTDAQARAAYIAQHMADLPHRYQDLLPAMRGDAGFMKAAEGEIRRLRAWINAHYWGVEPGADQFGSE
jgi:hypothetical protein